MDDPPGSDLPAAVLVELGTGGDWLSSWWTVVALLVLAALGVLWAVRRRARGAVRDERASQSALRHREVPVGGFRGGALA